MKEPDHRLPHDIRRLLMIVGKPKVHRYAGRLYGKSPVVTRITKTRPRRERE